jgi:hypothetical protein
MAALIIMDDAPYDSIVSYVICSGRTIAPHGASVSRIIKITNNIGLLKAVVSSPITGNFSASIPALPWTEFTVEAVGAAGENSVTYAHCREF